MLNKSIKYIIFILILILLIILIKQYLPGIWQVLKNNWAPIVAILAFIVSFLTLYNTHYRSFSLRVFSSGRYCISINPKNPMQFAISMPLIFINDGAVSGVIEDLALCVVSADKSIKYVFFPHLFITNRDLNMKREDKPLQAESFVSFQLKARESIVKNIMFIPIKNNIPKFIGGYKLSIHIKAINAKFKKAVEEDINIKKEDIAEIETGIPPLKPGQTAYVPLVTMKEEIFGTLEEKYKDI